MSNDTKQEWKDFIKTWAPMLVAVAGWVWTASAVYSQTDENRRVNESQQVILNNLNTLVNQHQVLIERNDREIERLRASSRSNP